MEWSAQDIERGDDPFAHHSGLATADQRERFGLWDYWVVEHPRVPERQDGPWLPGVGDRRHERLPADLPGRWSCRCTGFLKVDPVLPGRFHAWRSFCHHAVASYVQ